MSANAPQTPLSDKPIESFDPATQEKIRQFCYEWALALRRVTGHVVEDTEISLPEDLSTSEPEKLTDTQEK